MPDFRAAESPGRNSAELRGNRGRRAPTAPDGETHRISVYQDFCHFRASLELRNAAD